jgi:hypothetical protein
LIVGQLKLNTEILVDWVLLLSGSVIFASLQQIFHKEGLRGMYRGLAPTVLALLPNWAVSFLPSLSMFYLRLRMYYVLNEVYNK